jgi:hypothetical protein
LPEYRNIPELKEEGIISYITSAGYTSEYWYQSVKTCIRRMMSGDEKSNFLAFDYLISVYHNIKTEEMIKNEMADNDSLTVQMEYLNIPSGTTGKAYFKPTMFPRNIKKAFYPQKLDTFNPKKNPYAIPKTDGEIRFLAVDVATRAGKKNDNTIMSCIRLIPSMGKGYERHLVYLESHKGENTVVQAGRVKDIFFDFEADYIILDLAQAGISLYDMMSQVTTNDDRGVQYPAFTVVDEHFDFVEDKLRKELRERTLGKSPIPVIFPIIANAGLNSQIAVALRNTLQKKLWNFLIPEGDAEEYMIRTNKEYTVDSMDADTTAFFNHPYVQTSLAIGECIALDLTLMNGQIKLVEKSGNYKDRFTTIAYANFIASQFDKELLKETEEKDDWGAIEAITMFI